MSFNHLTESCIDKCTLALNVCITSSILTFILSTASNNISQVDKLWSILPIVYACIFISNTKTTLMAMLVFLWGARLTCNFYRRGGYTGIFPKIWSGDEDYRWVYVRNGFLHPILKNQFVWVLFNLMFVSVYQNILLFLIISPSLVACCYDDDTNDTLTIVDGVATILFLMFICIETKADQEQWEFQMEKQARKKESYKQGLSSSNDMRDDYDGLFCQTGLFAIVRKPNYAAEQGIWISYYLFSISSSQSSGNSSSMINVSIIGCILLVVLFQGSGWLTEKISVMKYPTYAEYKKRVPLYIPNNISCIVSYFDNSK